MHTITCILRGLDFKNCGPTQLIPWSVIGSESWWKVSRLLLGHLSGPAWCQPPSSSKREKREKLPLLLQLNGRFGGFCGVSFSSPDFYLKFWVLTLKVMWGCTTLSKQSSIIQSSKYSNSFTHCPSVVSYIVQKGPIWMVLKPSQVTQFTCKWEFNSCG